MLEDLTQLTAFLKEKGGDTPDYETWVIKGYKLAPELVGPEGYVPEGLFEIGAQDETDLQAQLCAEGEPEKSTVFQVVKLVSKDQEPEQVLLNAVRWQSFPEPDAVLVCSRDKEIIAAAKEQLSQSTILESQAVFLVTLE